MSEDARQLSREELFRIVWASPASQVAAELGIDERTLRSICSRHAIPCPSDAYWARVNGGEHFALPPLRVVQDPALQQIEITAKLAKKEAPEPKSAVRNVKSHTGPTEESIQPPAELSIGLQN